MCAAPFTLTSIDFISLVDIAVAGTPGCSVLEPRAKLDLVQSLSSLVAGFCCKEQTCCNAEMARGESVAFRVQ